MAESRNRIELAPESEGDVIPSTIDRFVRATAILQRIARRLEADGIDWTKPRQAIGPADASSAVTRRRAGEARERGRRGTGRPLRRKGAAHSERERL